MKNFFLALLILMFLALTACGSASTGNQNGSALSGSSITGTLSTAGKIAVGSLKLEGTDQAITAKQAAELLPLWQLYKEVSTSDTSAQEEVGAAADAIQSAMTAEQLQSITKMNLARQDMFSFMQNSSSSSSSQKSGTSSNGQSFGPPGGDMPGGAPPDIAGGVGSISSSSSSKSTSTQTGTQQTSAASSKNQIPSALLDALITLLEKRAGS